jgi:hypothetical protein
MNPSWMLVVVVMQFTDYESCKAQAEHENAYLETIGTDVAICIAEAPYAPPETLRPIARKEQ